MREQRGADICGEVFRNIFPLQAHRRDKHQVGAWKRKRTVTTTTTRPKRARVTEGTLVLCYIIILYIIILATILLYYILL